MSASKPSTYTQGHHRTVTANHASRTAEMEGAFVLSHLQPHFHILDVGCGPGTITTGFAKYVPQGSVTGVDLTEDVISQALEHLSKQSPPPPNITFTTGNVLEGLPYEDAKFDVVFCNQTLIHIPEPVKALREMKRVCKSGGIVASREGDFPFRWVPYLEGLQLFNKYMYEMMFGSTDSPHPDNPPQPTAHRSGSLIHVFAREAGFDPERIEKGASVESFNTRERRKFVSDVMIARIQQGGTKEKFMERGATEENIERIVSDFKKWADDVDGWNAILQCETVCHN